MEVGEYRLVWTTRALTQIHKVHEHISKHSLEKATKVILEIGEAIEKAISNPEIYNADKYKTKNDGSYRAFEKHHYRIGYRCAKKIIRVLYVRHTSMEPV